MVTLVEWLKIDDRIIFFAIAFRLDDVIRKTFGADLPDMGVLFGGSDPANVADALDTGEILLDTELFYILVPLVAFHRMRCGKQSGATAQYLFVALHALGDARLYLVGQKIETLAGALLGAGSDEMPAQDGHTEASQQGGPCHGDVAADDGTAQPLPLLQVGSQNQSGHATQGNKYLQQDQRIVEIAFGERAQAMSGTPNRHSRYQHRRRSDTSGPVSKSRPRETGNEQVGQQAIATARRRPATKHHRADEYQQAQKAQNFQARTPTPAQWGQLEPGNEDGCYDQHACRVTQPPGEPDGPLQRRRGDSAQHQAGRAGGGANQAHGQGNHAKLEYLLRLRERAG